MKRNRSTPSPRIFFPLLTLLLTAMLSACAPPPEGAGFGEHLSRLQGEQDRVNAEIAELRANLIRAEARIEDQQREIATLRQQLQTQKVTPTGGNAVSTVPESSPTKTTPAPATSPAERYYRAFSAYAAGRFAQAIPEFQAFLKEFPENQFAVHAKYWLGECYFAQQQYELAVAEFEEVVSDDPHGVKTADALTKMASALHKLGEEERAQQALELLHARFPQAGQPQRNQ